MGIERLEIKGYRSLRDVVWEPGQLNVLIGPNASGKSNLLDACMLFQEAARGRLAEGVVRRGGITPLCWDQKEDAIQWSLKTPYRDTSMDFSYRLALRRRGISEGFQIELEQLRSGEREFLKRTPTKATFAFRDETVVWGDEIPADQTLLSLASSPRGSVEAGLLQRQIERWSFYDAIHVDRESPVRQATVTRLEKRIAPDGRNLTAVLHTLYTSDREFRRAVDAAMHAAFGEEYEELIFPPAADQRVQLRLRWRSLSSEQSAADLSDGTLRFLILVAILANPDPGTLIAIDEPETNLHPRMFSILAELAQDAAERTQVVFTTHSPEFLDAFTGAPPTTTVAERVDGETRLKNVDGEELQRWLREYSLGSLFSSGDLEALA
jgi:predicted ATPase